MDDLFEDLARQNLAEAAADEADAEYRERRDARRQAEHAKGVRLGWHDEDGNAPEVDPEIEEEFELEYDEE